MKLQVYYFQALLERIIEYVGIWLGFFLHDSDADAHCL